MLKPIVYVLGKQVLKEPRKQKRRFRTKLKTQHVESLKTESCSELDFSLEKIVSLPEIKQRSFKFTPKTQKLTLFKEHADRLMLLKKRTTYMNYRGAKSSKMKKDLEAKKKRLDNMRAEILSEMQFLREIKLRHDKMYACINKNGNSNSIKA